MKKHLDFRRPLEYVSSYILWPGLFPACLLKISKEQLEALHDPEPNRWFCFILAIIYCFIPSTKVVHANYRQFHKHRKAQIKIQRSFPAGDITTNIWKVIFFFFFFFFVTSNENDVFSCTELNNKGITFPFFPPRI